MGIFATARFPFVNTHNSYTTSQRYEGQCTTYVINRTSYVFGGKPCMTSYGDARTWMSSGTLGYGWVRRSDNNVVDGDVVVLDDGKYGHVLFCETNYTISQSNVRYPGGDGSWNWDVYNAGLYSCINHYITDLNGYLGMKYIGRLHYTGQPDPGHQDDPEDPPSPEAIWVPGYYEENVITETIEVDYTGTIYECGVGTFGDQSGTQDEPKAPTRISGSTSRLNQRWEPFNMYTYERLLTYDTKKDPVWSGWELMYEGSDSFLLGNQPSYNNGWQMDWED